MDLFPFYLKKSLNKILNLKKFSMSRGGGVEGRTQIQILESIHELQKKIEKFSKSRGGGGG